ncbi:adenine methyltransferase [Lactococcus formosensis]|uniref:adenine methyltransferase n=1 Tax=Lactococcus formosensis TaxID=1281486 RepID=UPI00243613A5|nr:adenine methyltransferase [Lactococcus formosensis]MDG6155226.1 adenine methyltransferase [Lactococcus formosensis]
MLSLLLNGNKMLDGVKQMTYNRSAQHSTAQHSTAQHSTAQHSTAQHSTAQHSTAQHSTSGRHPPIFTCTETLRTPWSVFWHLQ